MRDLTGGERSSAARQAAATLAALRAKALRIHCITNPIAMSFTANVLLALGVTPTMSSAPSEMSDFVTASDVLCINLGTLSTDRCEAIDIAIDHALQQQKPWVLDPVLIDVSAGRRTYALSLLTRKPAVVRGNRTEIAALADVDQHATLALAARSGGIVAQTGYEDIVTDGYRVARVTNGHPMMASITAMGCASAAVVAASLAGHADALTATISALVIIGVAGELAGRDATGPGSFQVSLLDRLYDLDPDTLQHTAKIT